MDFDSLKKKYNKLVIDMNDYEYIKNIANSGQSIVYLYKDKRSGEEVVIKEFLELDEHFSREVEILIEAEHKRIIEIKGFNVIDKKGIIVLPFYKNKSLNKFCRGSEGKKLTPTQKTIIAAKIAEVILYMHKNDIINRDIKPDNVLIDDKLMPVLCDFGLSRKYANNLKSFCGTDFFAAPEIVNNEENYTKKVDSYSYGMLLYCLTEKNVINTILEDFNEDEKTINELILKCRSKSPNDRPGFDEIYNMFVEHKVYFKGTNFDEFDFQWASDTLDFTGENSDDVRNKAWELSIKYSPLKYKKEDVIERMKYIKIAARKLIKLLD